MTVNFTPHSKMISRQHELGKAIIPFLVDKYHPKSVAEFGCGVGEFLRMFARECRTADYLGLDGTDYKKRLAIPEYNFYLMDLSTVKVGLWRQCDIVVCMEVIEHLTNEAGINLLKVMASCKPKAILFSAATPGQGGDHHISERPHEYWHEKFKKLGWNYLDIIRPIIKDNKIIPFWYRNNIFVYERKK